MRVDVEHCCHKEYVTKYFYFKTDNPFPKPQPPPFSIPLKKLNVPHPSAHSCQVPRRLGHFVHNKHVTNPQLLSWLMLAMLPVHQVQLGPPQLDVPVVSNYVSCQHWRMTKLVRPELYICPAVYTCRAGSRWPTPCLASPVFSISHAVLHGCGWVDGNDRTSLVIPGWSPSVKEGRLSHPPLWG